MCASWHEWRTLRSWVHQLGSLCFTTLTWLGILKMYNLSHKLYDHRQVTSLISASIPLSIKWKGQTRQSWSYLPSLTPYMFYEWVGKDHCKFIFDPGTKTQCPHPTRGKWYHFYIINTQLLQYHSFIYQNCVKVLLCAAHCARHWGSYKV